MPTAQETAKAKAEADVKAKAEKDAKAASDKAKAAAKPAAPAAKTAAPAAKPAAPAAKTAAPAAAPSSSSIFFAVEKGPVCSDQYPSDPKFNVPRDIISYDGNEFSASPCSQMCLYSYNYAASSSCVVSNDGDRLTIIYDGGGDVTFNSATYTPTKIRLFKPSLHKFNGTQADGEMIIEHSARAASNTGLLVCIPLISNGALSNASTILEDIILHSPTVEDESLSLSISDFSLNHIIPTAPYYTYTGPLPYDKCINSATYQYVVFHPSRNGGITLSKTPMKGFGAMISQSFVVAFKEKGIFFNATGTSKNGFSGEDQIYIQCQPAGESADEGLYRESKDPSIGLSGDPSNMLSMILYVVLGIVIIVVSFKLMEYILTTVSKNKPDFTGPTEG
jgi:hypothetical protein